MFEIKLISSPIDEPGACECRGYAGTANNFDQPSLPIDFKELF